MAASKQASKHVRTLQTYFRNAASVGLTQARPNYVLHYTVPDYVVSFPVLPQSNSLAAVCCPPF